MLHVWLIWIHVTVILTVQQERTAVMTAVTGAVCPLWLLTSDTEAYKHLPRKNASKTLKYVRNVLIISTISLL